MKSIAFTGHRPNKLYGYDLNNEGYNELRNILSDILKNEIYNYDADTFITGGALGFDTLAFYVCDNLIQEYGGNQILAIPFGKQASAWPKESQITYKEMKKVSTCIYVDDYEKIQHKRYKKW